MANQPKKYKKFVATAATATLVASAIVPVASAAEFKDVAGSDHEVAINALAEEGIINGYSDGTFKPNQTINRGQVVKMLGRWLEAQGQEIPEDWKTEQRFSDLALTAEEELVQYAALAKDAGVFAGSNGKLNYTQNMQRQQMAVVIVRAIKEIAGVDLVAEYKEEGHVTEISDLDKAFSAEQRNAIVALEYAGITNVSNFRPAESVTRGQFASFLHRTIENVLNAEVDAAVKAINNTTVEVTFDEEVGNLNELNFAIEGLEISNKAVKQTNKKVVVLTTSAQTADVEYTVTLNDEKIGSFKGLAAVIPTAIDVVEQSVQAPLGKQVTVKAQVKVAEGQSKAGIPVTFNIVNAQGNAQNPGGSLNPAIVAEAHTDENGVATYTYTRYASTANQLATSDEVQAYSTGNPTARSFGKVYWAAFQPLTIAEVTEGNTVNNGAKKVYKVKAALEHTEYQDRSFTINGKTYDAGSYVNIAFEENLNVTPDKAVKAVDVIDANGVSLSYPGQFTTSLGNQSDVKVVKLKLDKNGEATFTLSGSNGKVTPIVFADQKENPANASGQYGRFNPTELFAKAPTVDFSKIQVLGVKLTSVGTKDASAYRTVPTFGQKNSNSSARVFSYSDDAPLATGKSASTKLAEDTANTGGRDYKAVVTDKAGKLAPSGTVVKVSVASGSALKTTGPIFLVDNNRHIVYQLDNTKETEEFALATDSKGEVSFTLFGNKDSYATPTVFVETGDKTGLDKNDLQEVGEIVYFGDVKITTAKLTVNGKDETTPTVTEAATFSYQTVDQNNKAYFNGTEFNVNFQVDTTFSAATIYNAKTNAYLGTVNQGSAGSGNFTVRTVDGIASIKAVSTNGNTVSVHATSAGLPSLSASAYFSKVTTEGIAPGQSVTGKVIAIDKNTNRILLSNSNGSVVYELSYDDAVLYTGNSQFIEDTFEHDLSVNDELTFTQATDTAKKIFKNTDATSRVALKDDVKLVLAYDNSVYDFGSYSSATPPVLTAGTIGAAKKATIEIQGNNVTLKNLVLDGDLEVTDKVRNDFTLDNVTVTGTTTVNGGDGNTFNATGSSLAVVILNIKEHIALTNSTITELVAKVTGSSVTGTGNVAAVTFAAGVTPPVIDSALNAPTATKEVPVESAKITTTSGDTVEITFTAGTNTTGVAVTNGTVATTSGDTVTFTISPVLAAGSVVTLTLGGKEYTATYTGGISALTFTRKY
ncbi:S-layer homology domain-containing protein [Lysinibacillus sp. NPDC097287]|uniref:S-layer homology domain-containing protein n=1 Tax=Lysinibacillus sp. NPDC097287 TaxID=3364144 RepID=UPI00381D38A8